MQQRTQPGATPERVQPDRTDKDRKHEGDMPVPDEKRERAAEQPRSTGKERQPR